MEREKELKEAVLLPFANVRVRLEALRAWLNKDDEPKERGIRDNRDCIIKVKFQVLKFNLKENI